MKTKDVDKKTSYIKFKIGKEQFAISVYRVLEIIQFEHLTKIPNSSDYIPGVMNFRGAIVPIINMHKRFSLSDTHEGKIVIVVDVQENDQNVLMGLLVDDVSDVIEFDYKSIRAVPDMGINYNPEFLEGIVEINKEFVIVLDIDKVLDIEELSGITELIREEE